MEEDFEFFYFFITDILELSVIKELQNHIWSVLLILEAVRSN